MNNTAETQSNAMQALWFLAVGASAALVHFLVLVSIVNFTAITPAWANVGAFLIAFLVSFFGHFYLTFKQSDHSNKSIQHNNNKKRHLPALGKWFSSSAAGFIANQGLFVLGLRSFGEQYYIVIWLLVTGVITVMTFALGKFWAFKS
ncbi:MULTISPECIES: GtrA family protein [unclassified Psychrobacter]|uniref:GtrA family protein n=1 Tax=unclassified Psychrobacter TaxID=196806 RepID=UPI0025D3201E|nr:MULTISPECIES: GtrA family protein [unclassified Psychrobacter]